MNIELPKYDVIIAGAGLAGLSLASMLADHPVLGSKKVLIVDRDDKVANDRTWCFWARPDEPLPGVPEHRWDACVFYASGFECRFPTEPYQYRMVRGSDFYRWSRERIATNPNMAWLKAGIRHIDAETGRVETDAGVFTADLVFNSALVNRTVLPETPLFEAPFTQIKGAGEGNHVRLLQHFKGWLVETATPVFDPSCVTFMDFRIPQDGDTRFVYVLPFSPTRALVEFTVFSPALLQADAYDRHLNDYLKKFLGCSEYRVEETEFGIIPMTDAAFPPVSGSRVVNIGTAGGYVKGSSGYAFKRTQRKLRALVDNWAQTGAVHPEVAASPAHFQWFDSILLHVLHKKGDLGGEVFRRMFASLSPQTVFRFLDEDSTFAENLSVMATAPKAPFTWEAFRSFGRMVFKT